ncbi:MAG: hypothetical protein VB092_09100 [Oscillospiraceae bacterium]|nr:hypothetical protein [Oscillospiraceae bacterium]
MPLYAKVRKIVKRHSLLLFGYPRNIDGIVYAIEAVPDSAFKTLWAETAYINKKGTSRALDADFSTPSSTSEAPHTAVPFDAIIRTNTKNNQESGRDGESGKGGESGAKGAEEAGAVQRKASAKGAQEVSPLNLTQVKKMLQDVKDGNAPIIEEQQSDRISSSAARRRIGLTFPACVLYNYFHPVGAAELNN